MLSILKEMQQSLKEDSGFNNCQAIAKSLLSMGYADDIVMTYQICHDIADLAQNNQLTSIHIKISGITDFDAEYYYENGYANYEDLTADKLENMLYDLIQEMEE